MLYKDWLNLWLQSFVKPACKAKTYINYAGIIKNHIAPSLGGRDVANLDCLTLQKFVAGLSNKGLSPGTVNLIITVMQSSLKCAYATAKTATYVADNVRRPKIMPRGANCFSPAEQALIERGIMQANKPRMFGVILCLYSGLRIGELLALKWEDIDFKGGLLYVNRTGRDGRDGRGNYTLICNSPKTSSSRRCIPLPAQIIRGLRAIKAHSRSPYVLSSGGKPLLVRCYQRSFERLLKSLNIPVRGFHALRHTFATRALGCGMDVKMLSEILGHRSPATTLNRYVHCFLSEKRKMMNKLAQTLPPPAAKN